MTETPPDTTTALTPAADLLRRYAAGERDFRGSRLSGAELSRANLSGANLGWSTFAKADFTLANLSDTDLSGADLSGADLSGADLSGARLTGARLSEARISGANLREANLFRTDLLWADLSRADLFAADLSGADLTDADLSGTNLSATSLFRANLSWTDLDGANFDGATLGLTLLTGTSLAPFCAVRPTLKHSGPSAIDHRSIAISLHAPSLLQFLVDTGMPLGYATESLRSLSETDLHQMLHSTFISYGGPDEAFARRLNEALATNRVKTWFFPVSAVPGTKLHRTMRDGVNNYDRTLLICSKDSLVRPGVLNELEEILQREAREAGASLLIPVLLDNFVFDGWNPTGQHSGLAQAIRDRVCADFRDLAQFDTQLLRLIDALKKVCPTSTPAPA